MLLKIEVRHVQHVERLELEIDLSKKQLTGIVGKNGVGKTTLIRAIRNGDQRDTHHARRPQIFCLPIESVEKALFAYYNDDAEFPHRLPEGRVPNGSRDLFNALQEAGVMSKAQIYAYLCGRNEPALQPLIAVLRGLLSRPQ